MATPHISAEPGDFAPAVLMPGDPKRAERIAHLLLPDARLVTDVRGMLGFTGTYQGKPLSVMGSGMGQPSAGIYVTELMKFYGVQRVIRVGTTGGIAAQVKVGDVIIATGAHTDSAMNNYRIPGVNFCPTASYNLVRAAADAVHEGERVHIGTIISKDHFYFAVPGQSEAAAAYGVLGVDMESAAIYAIAAEYGREALTVLTVSDHLFDKSVEMTSEERESKFQLALRLAVAAALS
ncbi:MAG: purine-nucleoside phosphorylase [Ancrocorticia sp.]|jgi:purine-nucleoside phosphorylase|nr:purine-nucleoside phosphorylase [Ancrocorticia sp.]MCI1896262.1 purine-nucleoside phosphorylase [Ancrocorticia sp.]MCI1933160.1 purine-nucleoside phosphorylase [Ancrocorticia sp.]MCI1963645.1 purine-nucleoside phosphorylase [Ancrocorticia sp.]MCI2002766.1 purine-nucleoside phosphorylase [Ancrocorticia sp.]